MTTATNFYEIRGMEADACVLYMRLEEEHIAFTEELAQMSLDAGATPEELEKVLEEANTAADSLEGRDGVCRFSNTEDLIVSLTDLQEGNWSASSSCSLGAEGAECETTGTFSNADCEGDLFSGTLE
ncbi:MAG: hypothetical protein JXA21_14000 [Anaerolineae bacterium]|nr:hypothetical protein [Anaerolineae bacterium]